MLKVPCRIHHQLSEALSIVSSHGFPLSWPSLLPKLISNLRFAANYSILNGLLGAANSLLLKFRHSTDTSTLCLNLKYCIDGFATPLLDVFVKATQFISANAIASSSDILCHFFECQRLSCKIFHSLNSTELLEFFDDPMQGG